MVTRLVTDRDLSTDDFQIIDGVVHAVVTRRVYDGEFFPNHKRGGGATADGRCVLTVQNGYGTFHIDFIRTKGSGTSNLAKLPDNAPTPDSLLEVQLFDGTTVYIDAQSRIVKAKNVANNQRYIVDLTGYFS